MDEMEWFRVMSADLWNFLVMKIKSNIHVCISKKRKRKLN